MSDKPNNIVFICTGNTCRSPMAEGFAKSTGLEGYNFSSKGVCVSGGSPSLFAVTAMTEYGIDISGKKSEPVTESNLHDADFILTMTGSHKHMILSSFGHTLVNLDKRVYTLAEFATGKNIDVSDPFGMDLDIYRQCAKEIREYVMEAVKKIKEI